MDEPESGELFLASPEQIVENVTVGFGRGTAKCRETGKTLRPGERVVFRCFRLADSDHWSTHGVFLPAVAPETAAPEMDEPADAILAYGTLAVASDSETRRADLILRDIGVDDTIHVTE